MLTALVVLLRSIALMCRGRGLAGSYTAGTLPIVLFVPSRDRDGRDIDHDYWVTSALETLGTLFRGATAYPRARGVWRDDERGGELRYDEPTIVTCYADPAAMTDATRSWLRAFLPQLDRRLHDVGWGLLLAMTGMIWILPQGPRP